MSFPDSRITTNRGSDIDADVQFTDEDGNQKVVAREDQRTPAELEAARREIAELRERVKVLERIATDGNTSAAREQARIAAEIEALRALPAAREEKSE